MVVEKEKHGHGFVFGQALCDSVVSYAVKQLGRVALMT
jgi:hypothetical protein